MALGDWKKYAKMAGGTVTVFAAISGGVIAVESRYAHADDVKQILMNSKQQLELYQNHQREVVLFQVDYYADRIKQLEDERRRAQVVHSSPTTSSTTKAITRTPSDINLEIEDLRKRKDFAEKKIVGR